MTDLPFVDYQYPSRPADGPPLVIVGEAPGSEEVRQGMPFAGRSGKLLDENLKAAGIERAACLVANVFRYQPPGNKVGHFFASRTRARKLGVGVAETLGPFGTSDYCLADSAGEVEHLAQVLNAVRPVVIVALGRTPLWALTGRNGIMQLRGRVLPCRLLPSAEVIPTFHPSYILRGQRAEEPTFLADLRLAVSHRTGS